MATPLTHFVGGDVCPQHTPLAAVGARLAELLVSAAAELSEAPRAELAPRPPPSVTAVSRSDGCVSCCLATSRLEVVAGFAAACWVVRLSPGARARPAELPRPHGRRPARPSPARSSRPHVAECGGPRPVRRCPVRPRRGWDPDRAGGGLCPPLGGDLDHRWFAARRVPSGVSGIGLPRRARPTVAGRRGGRGAARCTARMRGVGRPGLRPRRAHHRGRRLGPRGDRRPGPRLPARARRRGRPAGPRDDGPSGDIVGRRRAVRGRPVGADRRRDPEHLSNVDLPPRRRRRWPRPGPR